MQEERWKEEGAQDRGKGQPGSPTAEGVRGARVPEAGGPGGGVKETRRGSLDGGSARLGVCRTDQWGTAQLRVGQ